MSDFYLAVTYVIGNEGGLSVNPHDVGGITKYGISLRLLQNLHPETLKYYGIFDTPTEQTIRDLTIEQAQKIYYGEFWIHAPFEKITAQIVCNYIFDMAVNMGIAPAIKCAQRAIWSYNSNRQILTEDGILGDETLRLINIANPFAYIASMRSERAGDYRVITALKPQEESNLQGWLNRAYTK